MRPTEWSSSRQGSSRGDTACVWQLQEGEGFDFELQRPGAGIPPEEDPIATDSALLLREAFAKDSPALRALFDALVDLLSGEQAIPSSWGAGPRFSASQC